MSQYQLTQSIYASNLKSRAVLVMNYLIYRSNKENTCFPSIKTIARDVHVSINTVKRALRDLLTAGFIKKEARFAETKNGAQTSNLYTLFQGNIERNETVKGKNMNKELEADNENEITEEVEILEVKSQENDIRIPQDNITDINDIDGGNFVEDTTGKNKVEEGKNVISEQLVQINLKSKFSLKNFVERNVSQSIKRAIKMIMYTFPTNGGLPPRPM